MILAGVLLKLGGYGLIRVAFPVCPWAASELAWWVGLIGVIGIVYGALVAMGQTDFKKLLAYSSVSHMGFVVLGLAAWSAGDRPQYWQWGVNGAMFQMVAHGITASALFFVVGVVYDRAHHRDLNRFGGLKEPMPLYGGLSAILFFASMGLPGAVRVRRRVLRVGGRVELLPGAGDPRGAERDPDRRLPAWTWQRVYLGTNPATKASRSCRSAEAAVLLPFVVLAIALGVLPGVLLFNWMEPSVQGWVENLARSSRNPPESRTRLAGTPPASPRSTARGRPDLAFQPGQQAALAEFFPLDQFVPQFAGGDVGPRGLARRGSGR